MTASMWHLTKLECTLYYEPEYKTNFTHSYPKTITTNNAGESKS